MKKQKKRLCIFIALIMTFGLFAGFPLSASAAMPAGAALSQDSAGSYG